jgi:hypothetical protein
VFVNADRDRPPVVDADEPILRRHPPIPRMSIQSNRAALSFRPITQLDVNGTIVFCDERGGTSARAIIVSHTGRPRVSMRDASGRSLLCAASSP